MDSYWIPGVNNHGGHGRWAFAELTEVYQIESDFASKVESEFERVIEETLANKGQSEDASRQQQADEAMAVVEELRGKLRTGGRKFTHDEMNER
jgi:type III restriction enzyme